MEGQCNAVEGQWKVKERQWEVNERRGFTCPMKVLASGMPNGTSDRMTVACIETVKERQ